MAATKTKLYDPPLDLPMKIRLQMMQEDIASAICNSRQHCAIAQTLYRELKLPVGRVRVTQSGVSIAKGRYRHYYRPSHRACRLVRDFDDGKEVHPIVFCLHFSGRSKISPVDEERKMQVNIRRRAATAALLAQGLKPKAYPRGRYGI